MKKLHSLALIAALAAFAALPALAADAPANLLFTDGACAAATPAVPAEAAPEDGVSLEDLEGVGLPAVEKKGVCDGNGCCYTFYSRTVYGNCGSCTRVWGTGGYERQQERTCSTCTGCGSWQTVSETCHPC